MNIDSSFGPLGKSKVLCNATGSIISTKDSQLIIPCCLDLVDNIFLYHQCNQLINQALVRGDGLHSSMIITNQLITKVNEQLNINGRFKEQWRIRLLHSLEILISTIKEIEYETTEYLIHKNIWYQERNVLSWFQNICLHTLIPSCNISIANSIVTIMYKWIIQVIFANDNLNNDVDLNIIILQCNKIVKFYDLFVFDSPLDFMSDINSSNSPSISYEEVDYIVLPIDQVIIYGRCKDYSALSISRNTINNHKSHLFICIKTLFVSTSDSTNTYKVCISNLDNYHNLMKRIGIDQIEELAKLLSSIHYINVLLTCDTIEAEILTMLVKYAIYTVDNISINHLNYIGQVANTIVYDTITDAISDLLIPSCTFIDTTTTTTTTTTTIVDCTHNRMGQFHNIQRIFIGQHNVVYLLFKEIQSMDMNRNHHYTSYKNNKSHIPRQLVISNHSKLKCGLYFNSIKRCINSILFAFNYKRINSNNINNNTNNNATNNTTDNMDKSNILKEDDITISYHQSNEYTSVDIDLNALELIKYKDIIQVVPGGGAAEMIWSILWNEVSKYLLLNHNGSNPQSLATLQSTSSTSLIETPCIDNINSATTTTTTTTFMNKIHGLVIRIVNKLHFHLIQRNHSSLLLPALSILCNMISQSYLEIPRLLLLNSIDVIEFPLLENKDLTESSRNSRIISIDKGLLQWKESLYAHIISDNDNKNNRVVSGIIVPTNTMDVVVDCDNNHNLHHFMSTSICKLDDAIKEQVYCTKQQFYHIFYNSIQVLQQYIRMNGNQGIIHVKKLKLLHIINKKTNNNDDDDELYNYH